MLKFIYRTLLYLYPRAYRESFAAEMMDVFLRRLHEARSQGSFTIFRFVAAEIAGLLSGAATEWIAASAGRIPDPAPALSVPDSDELAAAERQTALLTSKLVHAIAHHQFAKARLFAAEEEKARAALERIRARRHLSPKTS